MARSIRILVIVTCISAPGGGALGAESKEEKLTADETQAQYLRKSITYLGITPDRGVSVPEENIQVIEKAIRKKIELERFDYNAIDLGSAYTIDQFVKELREYVKKRAVDRAAAEAEYETRFKQARVLASDIDRIMSSAYFYIIRVTVYRNKPFTCPQDAILAAAQDCIPGQSGMLATVNATATFYRANLTEEGKPPYRLIKTVKHKPVASFEPFESEKAQVAYDLRRPQLHKEAGQRATAEAAADLAKWLSKEMKQIPDFQLKTPVTAALSDGVEFMLGKGDGVELDDTYDVAEFDAAGKKTVIGYVKVRDIGEAKGTGEGTPSYGEMVKERRKFVGGELLDEHPMVGMAVGVHGVFEYAFSDVLGEDKAGLYPGFGLYVDYDLASAVGITEFYLSVEADILFLGDEHILFHGMLGVKKKWYITSLVLSAGARFGASYYLLDEADAQLYAIGGDAVLGIEYYIFPEFSIYLKAAFRYFTEPLSSENDLYEAELGANGSLGVFLAF